MRITITLEFIYEFDETLIRCTPEQLGTATAKTMSDAATEAVLLRHGAGQPISSQSSFRFQ